MLLAIDVGNTNSVFSVLEGKEIISEWRCSTDGKMTSDQYYIWLQQLFLLQEILPNQIKRVIISSVVPDVTFNLKLLAKNYFQSKALIVGSPDCKLPLLVKVDRGVYVGADRIVNAVATFKLFGGNTAIVDFGTATTFDVIDDSGSYVGGVISPGVDLANKALPRAAAALPNVEVKRPKQVIGKNTIDCMQSGIYWGYLSLVEGVISKIKKERNIARVVATGGLASVFSRDTAIFDHIDPKLTIKGLSFISEFNKE